MNIGSDLTVKLSHDDKLFTRTLTYTAAWPDCLPFDHAQASLIGEHGSDEAVDIEVSLKMEDFDLAITYYTAHEDDINNAEEVISRVMKFVASEAGVSE